MTGVDGGPKPPPYSPGHYVTNGQYGYHTAEQQPLLYQPHVRE